MKKFEKILSVALSIIIFLSICSFSVGAEEGKNLVYLGGQSFGLKFYNNGLIVIELENFFDGLNYNCPAKDGGIKVNDIIKEVNGEVIKTNEDLQRMISSSNGNSISILIERNGNEIEKTVKPKQNMSGMYLLGAWVRDSCAGIGTVTYYDENNNYFAALGHGVCDVDTSALLPLGYGEVVKANISGVTKSVKGKAGSLNGYFTDEIFGVLTKNTPSGIYGTINDNYIINQKKIEIASTDEVKTGKAQIYTTINGEETGCYDIEITKICNTSKKSNENFVIRVTSDEIVEKCGGIVQGMSGSPIVQDGKLVGAVTHVFVKSPCEGYGVMAQNMVAVFDD